MRKRVHWKVKTWGSFLLDVVRLSPFATPVFGLLRRIAWLAAPTIARGESYASLAPFTEGIIVMLNVARKPLNQFVVHGIQTLQFLDDFVARHAGRLARISFL
jgi:hypothetical protein